MMSASFEGMNKSDIYICKIHLPLRVKGKMRTKISLIYKCTKWSLNVFILCVKRWHKMCNECKYAKMIKSEKNLKLNWKNANTRDTFPQTLNQSAFFIKSKIIIIKSSNQINCNQFFHHQINTHTHTCTQFIPFIWLYYKFTHSANIYKVSEI